METLKNYDNTNQAAFVPYYSYSNNYNYISNLPFKINTIKFYVCVFIRKKET